MEAVELEKDFSTFCDTWEGLDLIQKKYLKANQKSLSSAFEEVKYFLESSIEQADVAQSEKNYSNIDLIIDKMKGS